MARSIGILTAGGDSPGLNAAIRAVGKAAQRAYGMHVIGFKDGFLGLMQNRFVRFDSDSLSGILTKGGTVLGTSRAKVDKMQMGDGKRMDMRSLMRDVVDQHDLEALVVLGGDGGDSGGGGDDPPGGVHEDGALDVAVAAAGPEAAHPATAKSRPAKRARSISSARVSRRNAGKRGPGRKESP